MNRKMRVTSLMDNHWSYVETKFTHLRLQIAQQQQQQQQRQQHSFIILEESCPDRSSLFVG
jgi:hypothetical protein